jgi:hypothetical protein
MFQKGDIVKRCDHNGVVVDHYFSDGSLYGKVIGFSDNSEGTWLQIEGEYYYRNGVRFINYYNPVFLKKTNIELYKKSVKPLKFQLTD